MSNRLISNLLWSCDGILFHSLINFCLTEGDAFEFQWNCLLHWINNGMKIRVISAILAWKFQIRSKISQKFYTMHSSLAVILCRLNHEMGLSSNFTFETEKKTPKILHLPWKRILQNEKRLHSSNLLALAVQQIWWSPKEV